MKATSLTYQGGGTLIPDRNYYVERRADDELLKYCLKGEFCLVLAARQSGKTSLVVRAVKKTLPELGVATSFIDFTEIGIAQSPIEKVYRSILAEIAKNLNLDVDIQEWWEERQRQFSPIYCLSLFLEDIVMKFIPGQMVIAFDEIDKLRSLPDHSDDFFAGIRAIYNRRSRVKDLKRLSFILVGHLTPRQITGDKEMTPWNIGQRIHLTDFDLENSLVLADGLSAESSLLKPIMRRIFHWTGGHPYFTHRVCKFLADKGDRITNESQVTRYVDDAVRKLKEEFEDQNFSPLQDWLSRWTSEMIYRLYGQIVTGHKVKFDDRSEHISLLLLSGLVKVQDGFLVVRNRLYSERFGREWVEEELRRMKAIAPHNFFYGMDVLKTAGEITHHLDLELSSEASKQYFTEREFFDDTIEPPIDEARERSGFTTLPKWMKSHVSRFSFGERIAHELARADLKLKVSEYLALIVITTFAGALLAAFLGGLSLISAFIGAVIGFFIPHIYVKRQQRQRLIRFNNQLPNMLNLVVAALRFGYSMMQAMNDMSKALPPPISEEFRRVVQEMQIGIPMETALANLLRRIPSDNLDFVITAINVQREAGGNLAEMLDNIRDHLCEQQFVYDTTEALDRLPFAVPYLIVTAMQILQWRIFSDYFSIAWQTLEGKTVIGIVYLLMTMLLGAFALIGRKLDREVYGQLIATGKKIKSTKNILWSMIFLALGWFAGLPKPVMVWLSLFLFFRSIAWYDWLIAGITLLAILICH